jgi:hypothetical protein
MLHKIIKNGKEERKKKKMKKEELLTRSRKIQFNIN